MRKWKILYWEKEGLNAEEKMLMIQDEELDNVITFCKMKGLRKYCIFNDKNKNVCNDGQRTTVRNTMEFKELESNKNEE